MGVHTNMCILNRTIAMYDPQDRPFVAHDRGTELVIEHIEKHWAPSVLSTQVLEALR